MHDTTGFIAAKLALAGVLTWGAEVWGRTGWLVLLWIACFTLDYVTGTLAAKRNHEWSSDRAREGLWHKGGMITIVLVSMLFDAALLLMVRAAAIELPVRGVIILPIVLAWYIITELGSILENAIKMGAENVPGWLKTGLKVVSDAIDKTGGEAVKGGGKDNEPDP